MITAYQKDISFSLSLLALKALPGLKVMGHSSLESGVVLGSGRDHRNPLLINAD